MGCGLGPQKWVELCTVVGVLRRPCSGVVISDCVFTRLDGNGVMISAYNRDVVIQRNEFAWTGDTAIAQVRCVHALCA
jgi:hypothetical protein